MALIAKAAKLWPGGIVPYLISSKIGGDLHQLIESGISLVTSAVPSIQLVARKAEPNYIHFAKYPDPKEQFGSNSTSIGMASGAQFIYVGSTTKSARTVAHEICHALGLLHEQNRGDRNNFVSIHWDNIAMIHRDQFTAQPRDQPMDFGPYDKRSIMHYRRKAYAMNESKDTITPLVAPPGLSEGARDDFSGATLSPGDIAALLNMYPPSAPFGESSDSGPALAGVNDTLLLAWKGRGNNSLATLKSRNGNFFINKSPLDDQSTNAPALAVLGGKFVVAWTGVGNNQINVMQSDDGTHWQRKVTLAHTSPSALALARVGAEIFLAWRGEDNRLNLIRSVDGMHWSPKITLNEMTESGPALGSVGPNLLLAWRGQGNNNLNIMRAPGGVVTGTKTTLSDQRTDERPALCLSGTRAFLAWRERATGFTSIMRSIDGLHWGDKFTADGEKTVGGPALVAWNHILVRAWTSAMGSYPVRSRAFAEI